MEFYLKIKEIGLFGYRLEMSSDGTAIYFYKPKKQGGKVKLTVVKSVTHNDKSLEFITALHSYLTGVSCAALSMFTDTAKFGGVELARDSYKAKLGMEFKDPLLSVSAVEDKTVNKRIGIGKGNTIRIITEDNCKFDLDGKLWTRR